MKNKKTEYIDKTFGEILLPMLESTNIYYIVIDTKYTTNHIEKLLPSCKDRGTIKWIAETNINAFDVMNMDEEARRSHIDDADLFPRLYFEMATFYMEFLSWLRARDLKVINVKAPKI